MNSEEIRKVALKHNLISFGMLDGFYINALVSFAKEIAQIERTANARTVETAASVYVDESMFKHVLSTVAAEIKLKGEKQ